MNRTCGVPSCRSSSESARDKGVTFHRLPKGAALRAEWVRAARLPSDASAASFVCSRHFRKADYEPYKTSKKFILRADAAPSIFPRAEGGEAESVEQIAQFLRDQEKPDEGEEVKDAAPEVPVALKGEKENETKEAQAQVEPVEEQPPGAFIKSEKGTFVQGSRVEVMDFGDVWYQAKVVEVDNDEEEVLIHYDKWSQRYDEWINVHSARLRFVEAPPPVVRPPPSEYSVGERCFARWTNNRRFPATVQKVLPDDKYEVLFDDGFARVIRASTMAKGVARRTSAAPPVPDSPATAAADPDSLIVPPPAPPVVPAPPPPLHNHLFDPECDHLGTKEERRSMKKKLDIKSLFFRKRKSSDRPPEPLDDADKSKTPKGGRGVKKATPKKGDDAATTPKKRKFADEAAEGAPKRRKKAAEAEAEKKKPEKKTKKVDAAEGEKKKAEVEVEKKKKKTESETEKKKTEGEAEKKKAEVEAEKTPEMAKKKRGPKSNKEKLEASPASSKTETNQKVPAVVPTVDEPLPNRTESILATPPPPDSKKILQKKLMSKSPRPGTPNTPPGENMSLRSILMSPPSERRPFVRLTDVNLSVPPPKPNAESETPNASVQSDRSALDSSTASEVTDQDRSSILDSTPLASAPIATAPKRFRSKSKTHLQDPYHHIKADERDWSCHWVNNVPVGTVVDSEPLASKDPTEQRHTVQVDDHRLPPKWKKLLSKKTGVTVDGKWEVILVCPSGRRYRNRKEMQERLKEDDYPTLADHLHGLLDYSAHRKQARRCGWDTTTPTVPQAYLVPPIQNLANSQLATPFGSSVSEDNCVYIGSLKVQIIENLLRCPQEGCFKNFRKNNLLQMHIKHYHPELCKFFGDTPNVADLAYARTVVEEPTTPIPKLKIELSERPSSHKRERKSESHQIKRESDGITYKTETDFDIAYDQQESHSFRINHDNFYSGKVATDTDFKSYQEPVKVEETLYPQWNIAKIKSPDPNDTSIKLTFQQKFVNSLKNKQAYANPRIRSPQYYPGNENDYHNIDTYKKPSKKSKKKHTFESWNNFSPAFDETKSSLGISDRPEENASSNYIVTEDVKMQPDIKIKEEKPENPSTIITESGEKIKIVHMKREEIINCHCGFGEEDGLMIQCDLCLCWQHAICNQIEKESEVPNKYVCYICLNPLRGRRSQKYLNDQDWLYEGRLPRSSKVESLADQSRTDMLRQSCELTANLLQIKDLMHALRCKIEVAEKKDHPKLYLWSKPWEENNDLLPDEKGGKKNGDVMVSDVSTVDFLPPGMKEETVETTQEIQEVQETEIPMEIAGENPPPTEVVDKTPTEVIDETPMEVVSETPMEVVNEPPMEVVGETPIMENPVEMPLEVVNEPPMEVVGETPTTENQVEAPIEAPMEVVTNNIEPSIQIPTESELPNADLLDKSFEIEPSVQPGDDKDKQVVSSQSPFGNLFASPGGTSLDLPITHSELEVLARNVPTLPPLPPVQAPQPEAAIESTDCRLNLLQHIENTYALLDARLDFIESKIAELESQGTLVIDDETADSFPRTKQTVQMLRRDLAVLEELGSVW